MPESEKTMENVAVQPNMSADRFKSFLNIPISPEWLAKRERTHARMVQINKAEAQAKIIEAPQLKTMELALGIKEPVKDETPVLLSTEQEQTVKEAFDNLGEGEAEQKAMFETFMGSTKDQKVFVGLYEKWDAEYKGNPDLQKKNSFSEYAKEKGIEYIRQYRKQLLKERANRFLDKNFDKADLTDEQIEEKRDKFRKSLDLYVQANYGDLSELNSLPEEERAAHRQILMAKFKVVMAENGFAAADKAEIESIFDFMVGLLEYEVFAVKEYEYTYEEMLLMAVENLTPEEWEARLKKALNKNAAELKETPKQQAQPVYGYSGTAEAGFGGSYERWQDVAKACMVHFEPVDQKNQPDLYKVKFTAFKDATFTPYLRMVYDPPESRDMKHLRFELEEEWADPESPNKGKPFGAKLSRVFRPEEMLKGVNSLILDYVINKKLNVRTTSSESANDVLKDTVMVHFANRLLYPNGIKDKALTEENIGKFERMMKVVLKDNPENPEYDTLLKRVDRMANLLERDDLLGYLQNIFKEDAGGIWNMEGLIKEINRRTPEKIKGSK